MRRPWIALFVAIIGLIAPLLFVRSSTHARAAVPPVVVIFMENHSYSKIESFPASTRSYLDSFASHGTRFSNYTEGADGAAGPSLPDYLAFAAGSNCGRTSDTVHAPDSGISSNCPKTLWDQLDGVGASWGVYMDAMDKPCSTTVTYNNGALDTPYALKHNPAAPFASVFNDASCKTHVLPFTSFPTRVGGALPDVSFVAPGICNDQHGSKSTSWSNCMPNSAALMTRGDDWLQRYVPGMLAAGAEVFITYDESGTMYAAEQGPGVTAGKVVGTALHHDGLLRAIENRFGLPCLNNACGATAVPL